MASITRLTQHVNAPPAEVYRALTDAEAVATWMVPDGMTSRVHAFDAREGGHFRISLTYDAPGEVGKSAENTDTYHGHFVKLVPGREVVQVMEFETADPAMKGEMTSSFTLTASDGGTDVLAVHENVPVGIKPEDNEAGWRMSLMKLASLVEAGESAPRLDSGIFGKGIEEEAMDFSNVVSRDEWLEARKALLAKEKEATKANDALRAERRALPLVRLEKDYSFDGPDGPVSLRELFGDRRQLIVQHFMFDPEWDEGCSSCSYMVDTLGPGHLQHLLGADTSFVIVSRAPLAKLEAWKTQKGWDLPWVSSYGTDFNWDFHASIDPSVAPVMVNFRDEEEMAQAGMEPFEGELPGYSVFIRDGSIVYHSYSTFARGVERLVSSVQFLDLTPLGR